MTQEDKSLLLQGLCARLPHHVIVQCKIIDFDTEESAHDNYTNHAKHPEYIGKGHLFLVDILTNRVQIKPILEGLSYKEKVYFEQMCNNGYASIDYCKPYLRPMYSMTEEEKHEVMILWNEDFASKESLYHCYPRTTDFYNAHHFDYRGLIEKGLALEAPEGMYN